MGRVERTGAGVRCGLRRRGLGRAVGCAVERLERRALLSTTISLPSFSDPSVLALNGSSGVTNGRLRITDSAVGQTGSAYFATPQDISQGFDTTFDFQLTNGTQPPADGFTFVLQSSGPTAIGQGGGGLGYQAMPGTSAAVKFDVYVPNPNGGTSFPQTGLYTNGQMDDNGVSVSPRVGINFPDGNVYRVELQYYPVPKLLTETIQNASKPGIGF